MSGTIANVVPNGKYWNITVKQKDGSEVTLKASVGRAVNAAQRFKTLGKVVQVTTSTHDNWALAIFTLDA